MLGLLQPPRVPSFSAPKHHFGRHAGELLIVRVVYVGFHSVLSLNSYPF